MLSSSIRVFAREKCLKFALRHCTVVLNLNHLDTKFTDEQQRQILNTLNTADVEHLSHLGIPLNRIRNIKTWQHKRGAFTTLLDVLDVDGLGVKVLEKICTNIIEQDVVAPAVPTKNRRQHLLPPLTKVLTQSLSNAVGLHLGPAGISWAKLSKDNQLLEWNFYKFAELAKRALPTDTFKLVQSVLDEIPRGNLYVFEQPPHRASLATSQNVSYIQHIEVLSMLLALINTSPVHNPDLVIKPGQTVDRDQNCVFYLRSNLSARMFRTLMGTERVSSTLAVNDLMDGEGSNSFPFCVKIDASFKDEYSSRNAIGKELLGQALLLVVAFMEICVKKNPNSLAMISRSKKILNDSK